MGLFLVPWLSIKLCKNRFSSCSRGWVLIFGLPFFQGPTSWRDRAGWWCLPSASILRPASSSLCWAPARTTKRRRSRKVRPSRNPVSKRHCWLSHEDSRCVKCWDESRLERLSACLNISTLLFEQCGLEILALFIGRCWFDSSPVVTRWLCQQVEFIQSEP